MPAHLTVTPRALLCALTTVLTLGGCATLAPPGAPEFSAMVLLGEDGAAVARVILAGATCPAIHIDGRALPMQLRAPAATPALRSTRSDPADSKASAFPVISCDAALPPGSRAASVLGRTLPLPRAQARRIVVIGDTGCRMKKADHAYQACNDGAAYPFARIAAAAAAWKPDLVVHVGDYHYRENACPPEQAGCTGSSWGYGWDAWRDDFFAPARALLDAAPWVVARGNHEACKRAGQGYWRLLDPRPLLAGRDCDDPANDAVGDFSAPYAVPLGEGAQLIVLDTANTPFKNQPRATLIAARQRFDALARQASYNIGVNHHPILGLHAKQNDDGTLEVLGGEPGVQAALRTQDGQLLPAGMQMLLSGHVHLWEQISFAGEQPSQFIAGFSGTFEDVVALPTPLPVDVRPAPGAVIEHLSTWLKDFGFMTMERSGADQWEVAVWNARGEQQNRCHVSGRKSQCEQGRLR